LEGLEGLYSFSFSPRNPTTFCPASNSTPFFTHFSAPERYRHNIVAFFVDQPAGAFPAKMLRLALARKVIRLLDFAPKSTLGEVERTERLAELGPLNHHRHEGAFPLA
jgi:hypothetical protein